MKAGPVFAETGIFIAFLDRSDHYHQAALRLFADPPRRWYTSLAVVAETYGWFLYRLGEESARTFRVALRPGDPAQATTWRRAAWGTGTRAPRRRLVRRETR